MVFRDKKLTCEKCGKTFFFTVTDQRRLSNELGTDNVEPPQHCPACRQESHPEPRVESAPQERRPKPKPQAQRPERKERPTPAVSASEFPLEEEGIEIKLIGTVKWFSPDKGYGFVTKADGQDLFFHRADIVDRQGGWPQENQQIEFQIRETDKGPEAFNVSILPPE
jgi:CspA family cold shock protein